MAKPDDDQSRLDRIAKTVPCGLYEYYLDENGGSHFPYFNEKMLEIFGVTSEELAADASIIWQLFHPDDREMVHQADIKANKSGELFFVQTRIVTRAGDEKWIQISSRPTSQKVGNSVVWSGYYLDITASKLDQAKFESLIQAIPDLILLIDEDGRYLQVNDSDYLALFFPQGFSLIGKTMHEVLPQVVADSYLEFIRNVLDGKGNNYLEYPLAALDGKIYYFESRARSVNETVNGKRVTISVVRDITEKNRARDELLMVQEKLRAVAVEDSKLLERSLLMKDMHDGLGSQLTYARVMVEHQKIDQAGLLEILQDCMTDLHLIVDTLSDEEASLFNAIIDFRYRIQKRFESVPILIHWELSLDGLPLVPQRVTLQILRVLQEALSNSIRHANPKNISLSAKFDAEANILKLAVVDDGKGFRPALPQGRGIFNMKKRAREIGADLDIETTDRGTQVSVTLKPR